MHENLLSGAPTPSGVETPRPDFQDKRMPGIMHSYFGQVGSKTSPTSTTTNSPAPAITIPIRNGLPRSKSGLRCAQSYSGRTTSTNSTSSLVEIDQQTIDTPPTTDSSCQTPAEIQPRSPGASDLYEVPKGGQAAENGGTLADGGFASITQALKNWVRPKSTFESKARRHQSLPTSSISRDSVAAAHFSNPTSSFHSPQHTCPSSPPSEKRESSISVQELNKLTLDAAVESREKATPPHTPRALSHNQPTQGAPSPRSIASATASDDGASGNTIASKSQIDGLPTGTSKGKLAVRIAEGRGLRPAYDPYCVCVFEWNEYISKGPRQDRMEVENSHNKSPQLSSIPIRRTDSDMGRPMAIPMRSRQSSTNGTDGERGLEKVTDPHWDHEATL